MNNEVVFTYTIYIPYVIKYGCMDRNDKVLRRLMKEHNVKPTTVLMGGSHDTWRAERAKRDYEKEMKDKARRRHCWIEKAIMGW